MQVLYCVDNDLRGACQSCERRTNKVPAISKYHEFSRQLVRCIHSVGPHGECHVKFNGCPGYSDNLAHAGIRR
jgi:hypothetical protein